VLHFTWTTSLSIKTFDLPAFNIAKQQHSRTVSAGTAPVAAPVQGAAQLSNPQSPAAIKLTTAAEAGLS
jgi:hypothetical protein